MNIELTNALTKVLLLGATGTIGRAAALALTEAGYAVTCFVRTASAVVPPETMRFVGDVTDPASVADALSQDSYDIVISCLASRNGRPADAWAIDHQATVGAIDAAKAHGVKHFILLSAICVQRPHLPFQHAKLAAEKALIDSGLEYSIVRPTAFFKSLSGQIARVQAGKSFLVFGDGHLTACKPISDGDLGRYLVRCIADPELHNRILPIGGPGPALTPLDQARMLFDLLGQEPRIKYVPVGLMRAIARGLAACGRIVPSIRDKAAFAAIGHYYATESMLVFDQDAGRYDADATPSFGQDTLADYYAAVVARDAQVERGDHSVF